MCDSVVATPFSPGTANNSPTTRAPANASVMNPLRRLRRASAVFTRAVSWGCRRVSGIGPNDRPDPGELSPPHAGDSPGRAGWNVYGIGLTELWRYSRDVDERRVERSRSSRARSTAEERSRARSFE